MSTQTVNQKDVLVALSNIIDPDFQRDIVSLGFVRNIQINGGSVSFEIALTTPACPVKNEFQRQAQAAVSAIEGVSAVNVHMTSQDNQAQEAFQNQVDTTLAQVQSIIAVSSCKGGVGKSTVAAVIAKELSDRGYKVGLLDADIYGPSVPALFGIRDAKVTVNQNNQLNPIEVGNLKVVSFGFLLGDAPAVMRGPIVTQYIQQLFFSVDWGQLDYLFIDMPPGTGDVQLTITQILRLTGAIIVTTRQTLSLIDVAKGILMFEKVKVPILGVIENMAYFTCDGCDKKHFIFGESQANTLEARFGVKTLAEIPVDAQLSQTLDQPIENDSVKKAVDQVIRAIGHTTSMDRTPPEIYFDAHSITLKFIDGTRWKVNNRELRLSCQCAVCVNELTGEQVLDPERIPEDIAAKEISPLGNYAIGIIWNDGHSSGIYPFTVIEKLA